MNKPADSQDWRTNLLLTAGVIVTVLMALLLAQFDGLQIRLQPTPMLLAGVTAVPLTPTPLPAVILPTTGPTQTPTTAPLPETTASTPANSLLPGVQCGRIPVGWSVYLVKPGDSLLSLAAISGATVSEISLVNCLQNGLVVAGMQIYLPVRPPTAVPCGPPSWWVQVRVQPGDTLFRLALRHNTTVYAIMQANCLNSTNLAAGRLLFLPPLPATPIRPFPTWTPSPTVSATPSATAVLTPTATATAVATATATASPTAVISVTATATSEPTATATTSPGNTPTATPTASATPPPSATATPTAVPPTATATLPPTDTATPQPTATATIPPTPTSTPSGG